MLWRRNQQLEQQLQYDVSDVRGVAPATVSRRVGRGRGGKGRGGDGEGYAPLLLAENEGPLMAGGGAGEGTSDTSSLLAEYGVEEDFGSNAAAGRKSSLAERIQSRLR